MSVHPTFCQICRHPSPGHEPDCPVATGEPQRGLVAPWSQELARAQQAQGPENQLGSTRATYYYSAQFVGGPHDGLNWIDPAMNYQLVIKDNSEGYYEFLSDLKYHWLPGQPAWKVAQEAERKKPVDKGGWGERWLLRLAKRVVKFLESAGVKE